MKNLKAILLKDLVSRLLYTLLKINNDFEEKIHNFRFLFKL